ncbi:MAG: hypothetical protein ABSA63_08800 [Thermoplasmata archaeon]|jgi:hypothetical protein
MRRRAALAIVVGAAALLATLSAVFVVPGSGPTVTVTAVNFVGDGPCGVAMEQVGFSAAPGAEEHFSGLVTDTQPDNCTIESISSETPGFTVIGANVPLLVTPGVTALSWLVRVPFYFDGNLTLNVSGAWAPWNGTYVYNSSCPSPCAQSVPPSGLYMYTFGEVLPAGWFIAEAGSLGVMIGAVAWAASRRR